jgi:hypothetical protein
LDAGEIIHGLHDRSLTALRLKEDWEMEFIEIRDTYSVFALAISEERCAVCLKKVHENRLLIEQRLFVGKCRISNEHSLRSAAMRRDLHEFSSTVVRSAFSYETIFSQVRTAKAITEIRRKHDPSRSIVAAVSVEKKAPPLGMHIFARGCHILH